MADLAPGRGCSRTHGASAPPVARWLVVAMLSLLSGFGGCQSCQLNLSHLIEIEYDQRVSFDHYYLKYPVYYLDGETHHLKSNGVWLVYNICQIKNEKSGAQTTPLDVSKFYVVFDNEEHYAVPFSPDDLGFPSMTASDAFAAYDSFKDEVITLPDPLVVPANSAKYALQWRLAILVRGADVGEQLALRYNNSAGESILLTPRSWPVESIPNPPASVDDLPTACRGPM